MVSGSVGGGKIIFPVGVINDRYWHTSLRARSQNVNW